MKTIIATGNSKMDSMLENSLKNTEKVQYLEELKGIKNVHDGAEMVVLSAYVPSIHNGDVAKHFVSFKEVIITLKNENIRVVVLMDTSTPFEMVDFLYQIGVYDFILSEDGSIDINEVLKIIGVPNTQEKAKAIVEKYKAQFQKRFENNLTSNKSEASSKEDFTFNNHINNPSTNGPVYNNTSDQLMISGGCKIFAFWGQNSNVGKRTVSQSFAAELACNMDKVLYVELDYFVPSFALTTGLTNPAKNMYQLCLSQEQFELENFISKKSEVELIHGKGFSKVVQAFPDNLHFLAFPMGFEQEMMPKINSEFIPAFIQALKESEYNAVVLSLPSNINSVFSFPVMLDKTDVIFHVMNNNTVSINEYPRFKEKLETTPLDLKKWKTLFNMIGEEIPKEALDRLIGETSIYAIPYDPLRSLHEMELQIGSPSIQEHMKEIVELLGLAAPNTNKKRKKLFGLL